MNSTQGTTTPPKAICILIRRVGKAGNREKRTGSHIPCVVADP